MGVMALVAVVLIGCLRGAADGGACEVVRVVGVDCMGELAATTLSK